MAGFELHSWLGESVYVASQEATFGCGEVHIACYVSAPLDYALFYEAGTLLELYGYTDVDWAGSPTDRRSSSGFMFSLGSAAIT